ncbi:phosphomethylpyrimidine synthase ThiC [Streptomyces sp. NPDC005820]|uniref:phosphomethylpyrimidine synthase ThiC n=1 Tax=Streptomyces sp. NPDC005820 TaxID=3157069 RepID=UPI0033FFC129
MRTIRIGNPGRGRRPLPCGAGERTVIIASVGTSQSSDSTEVEFKKCVAAANAGADVVADHSFYGDIPAFHARVAADVDACLSTVSCYEFAGRHPKREWPRLDSRRMVDLVAEQAARGVDLMTVHASLTRAETARIDRNARLIPTTSKGGGIIANYMRLTGRENPYYEHFDELLDVLADAGVTLSLGTTFRAGSVCDGWDELMAGEMRRMGELVERALARGVPVMVEGLGHAALSAIPTYIRLAKAYCRGVPYRVLPMATDRALGYDHISGAIAASVAVAHGADVVTAMSRAEHIGLPNWEDMEEGIIATRVAVACGELTKLGDFERERQMSRARWAQGCKGDWRMAVYPEGAERALAQRGRRHDHLIQCGMCGDFCGINAGIAAVKLGPTRLTDD